MQDDRLTEIAARLDGISPYPWTPSRSFTFWHGNRPDGDEVFACDVEADATFIAHAPADIAWLLADRAGLAAEVTRLRKIEAAAREADTQCADWCGSTSPTYRNLPCNCGGAALRAALESR